MRSGFSALRYWAPKKGETAGVDKLRAADGSIRTRVTTGNTMAPCVVIGERAARCCRMEHHLEPSFTSFRELNRKSRRGSGPDAPSVYTNHKARRYRCGTALPSQDWPVQVLILLIALSGDCGAGESSVAGRVIAAPGRARLRSPPPQTQLAEAPLTLWTPRRWRHGVVLPHAHLIAHSDLSGVQLKVKEHRREGSRGSEM
jgi:hypothetical protein